MPRGLWARKASHACGRQRRGGRQGAAGADWVRWAHLEQLHEPVELHEELDGALHRSRSQCMG